VVTDWCKLEVGSEDSRVDSDDQFSTIRPIIEHIGKFRDPRYRSNRIREYCQYLLPVCRRSDKISMCTRFGIGYHYIVQSQRTKYMHT